ncbi:MAG TPA: polymer-forming cytoskeletal protein [Steroidobacteraceae bacterium]|nr:polymer-forming cytoskeletal protein [Steroidobacteraceae bacterium]
MNDKPNRRILDRPSGVLSLLASGSRVTGDIETPGALVVGCHVRGDGNIGGELSISAEAHWEGDVHAQNAVVAGRITGCIVVRKKIEIAATAIIRGRVIACSIAMARGATIDGEVTITGDQPMVEFEEKRAPAGAAQTR